METPYDKTPPDSCLAKTAQTGKTAASGVLIFVIDEIGDARLRCAQLKKYVKEATDLIEKSDQKDHFFEVAGHLIYGIPDVLMKLDNAISAASLGISRLDYEETKNELRPDKADELENVLADNRLRYLNRRSTDVAPTVDQTLSASAPKYDRHRVETWMGMNVRHYVDRKTGEANTTELAEAAAGQFNIYEDTRDYVIPDAIYDLAVDVAEKEGFGVKLARKSDNTRSTQHPPKDNLMNAKTAANFLNKIADMTEATGRVPTAALSTLIAKLEGRDCTASSLAPKAVGAFRGLAAELSTQTNPSRVKLASTLRRILADTQEMPVAAQPEEQEQAQQMQQQAGAGEEFQKANPAISDEQAAEIDRQHEKNKSKFKA